MKQYKKSVLFSSSDRQSFLHGPLTFAVEVAMFNLAVLVLATVFIGGQFVS